MNTKVSDSNYLQKNKTFVNYIELERKAHEEKPTRLTEAALRAESALSTEAYDSIEVRFSPVVEALLKVNEFISVTAEDFKEAESHYQEISEAIVSELRWNSDEIAIHPQGSVATGTLIRSTFPNERFDIDAICEIASLEIGRKSPNEFFQDIGKSLKLLDHNIKITPKKRCWRIEWVGEKFYIDLTPSVTTKPNDTQMLNESTKSDVAYEATEIWVVNTPTNRWQSSNPKGMRQWVNDRNLESQVLVRKKLKIVTEGYDSITASVEGVPSQDIAANDLLLLAIRLFKRHRDMMVRNNKINKDYKPISIIIVTLLGQCVAAMAANNRSFRSIPAFMEDVAYTLPKLIDEELGYPNIPNPTASNENFADRWLEDEGARQKTFNAWISELKKDLSILVSATSDLKRFEIIGDIFGYSGSTGGPSGGGNGGIAIHKPASPSSNVPKTGLA